MLTMYKVLRTLTKNITHNSCPQGVNNAVEKVDNIKYMIKTIGEVLITYIKTQKKFPLVISGNVAEQLAFQPDLRFSECSRLNSDPQNYMSMP